MYKSFLYYINSLFALFFTSYSLSNDQIAPTIPDPILTPGEIDPNSTVDKFCVIGYTKTVRNVSEELKSKIKKKYNVEHINDKIEIDHLIPLELGGSNNETNLWPQSYTSKPYNAHLKDELENTMHKLVCEGKLKLEDAQKEISTDWIAAYNKYVKNIQPTIEK